jgi:hypothetical protein
LWEEQKSTQNIAKMMDALCVSKRSMPHQSQDQLLVEAGWLISWCSMIMRD